MNPILALYALALVACISAWLTARRDPRHRPVFLALLVSLDADLWQRAIARHVLAVNERPFVGFARLAFEVHRALHLAGPFVVAALAVVVLLRRRAWPVLVLYIAVIASLVATYPALRGAPQLAAQGIVTALCATVGLVCAGTSLKARQAPAARHVVTVAAVLAETWSVLSAYLGGEPVRDWSFAQMGCALFFVTAIAVQAEGLWKKSKR